MKIIKYIKMLIYGLIPYGIIVLYRRHNEYGTLHIPWNRNTTKFWDNHYKSKYSFDREDYLPLLRLLDKRGKFSLLDIGCGAGEGCKLIKKRFPEGEIYGADFSPLAIEKAKKSFPNIKFFVGDISKDDIPKNYDYITIVEALEHITNPFPIVDKCLKHVTKSLIISVPYTPNLPSGNVESGGVHVYSFNKDSFKTYNYKIVLIDKLHENTMPRIIFEIKPESSKKTCNYALHSLPKLV